MNIKTSQFLPYFINFTNTLGVAVIIILIIVVIMRYLCVSQPSASRQPSLSLTERWNGFFHLRCDLTVLSAHCAVEGKMSTDKSAQVLTQKNCKKWSFTLSCEPFFHTQESKPGHWVFSPMC